MGKRISVHKTLSSSFIILTLIFFASGGNAHAEVKGCAKKYYEAAAALDKKRAECGLAEDGQSVFCQDFAHVNIPILIQGFSFSINVGAAVRFLSSIKVIPDEFRKAAKLIQEAQAGSGKKLKRLSKKIARQVPGTTQAEVAKIISEANMNGSLCQDNHFLNAKEIRHFVEDEIVRL